MNNKEDITSDVHCQGDRGKEGQQHPIWEKFPSTPQNKPV